MDGGFAHASASLVLAVRVMSGVEQTEALSDPRLKILAVTLKRHVAPHIHFPQIHRWSSIANPLGSDFAHTPGRLQTDRVETRSDKTVFQLRRLT